MAIPVGLADPNQQERVFFRVADVCIALNFVLDPFIYVLLRGQCGQSCCCRACNPSRCWPCRKMNRQETSLASQLATKDEAKLAGELSLLPITLLLSSSSTTTPSSAAAALFCASAKVVQYRTHTPTTASSSFSSSSSSSLASFVLNLW